MNGALTLRGGHGRDSEARAQGVANEPFSGKADVADMAVHDQHDAAVRQSPPHHFTVLQGGLEFLTPPKSTPNEPQIRTPSTYFE